MNDLYSRIESLCAEKGVDITTMCKEAKVSRSILSEFKMGRTKKLSTETLTKIADFFNVSLDYLLGKTSFRNSADLFELWGITSNPYFEAPFDFGKIIQEERIAQGIDLETMSSALGITPSDLENCEEGILPLNYEWAEKMANYLDTNVSQLMFDNDLYIESVPEGFHDDVRAWEEATQKAEKEAMNEWRGIRKAPVKKVDDFDPDNELIAAYGDLTEENKEIIRGILKTLHDQQNKK